MNESQEVFGDSDFDLASLSMPRGVRLRRIESQDLDESSQMSFVPEPAPRLGDSAVAVPMVAAPSPVRGPGRPPGAKNKKQKTVADDEEKGLGEHWDTVELLVKGFLARVEELVKNISFNLQIANYRVRVLRGSFRYDLYEDVKRAMKIPTTHAQLRGDSDSKANMIDIFRWELNMMAEMVGAFVNCCVKIGDKIFVASETSEQGVPTVIMTPYSITAFKATTGYSKATLYRVCDLQQYLMEVQTQREKARWFSALKRSVLGSEAYFLDVVPMKYLKVDYDTRPPRLSKLIPSSFNDMMPILYAPHLPMIKQLAQEMKRPKTILSLIYYIFCDTNEEYAMIMGFLSLVVRGLKRPDALLNVVGPEGCGKTLLFYILMSAVLGKNNCTILQSINAVYGRFNTHKVGKYLIVNDDALPKALTGVSHLGGGDGNKSTTTGDTISVEAKGVDIAQVNNVASEINLSNHFSNSLLGDSGRRLKTVIGSSVVAHADLGLDTIMFWKWAHEAIVAEAPMFAAYLHGIDTDKAYEAVSRSEKLTAHRVAEVMYTKSRTEREIQQWITTGNFGGLGWPCKLHRDIPVTPLYFKDLFLNNARHLDSDYDLFRTTLINYCGDLMHVTDDLEGFTVEHHDVWKQYPSNIPFHKIENARIVLTARDVINFSHATERRVRRLRADCGFPVEGALSEEQKCVLRARLIGRARGEDQTGFVSRVPIRYFRNYLDIDDTEMYRNIDMPVSRSMTLHPMAIIENNATTSNFIVIDD